MSALKRPCCRWRALGNSHGELRLNNRRERTKTPEPSSNRMQMDSTWGDMEHCGGGQPENGSDAERPLDPGKFWEVVATNLKARKIRLLFVADAIPVELESVVEFLNEQMPGIEVLAVEVKRFKNQSNKTETFVPRVMGQHAKLRRPGSVSRRVVTEGEFIASCDERGKTVFSRILGLAGADSKRISWGDRGFSLGVYIEGTRVVFCAGYPPDA